MRGPDPVAPQRHDLLHLHPDAWDRIVADHDGTSSIPELRRWVARGWPVMRRRLMSGDPAGAVPAAVALPPGPGCRRFAFGVPEAAVLASVRPPLLSATLHAVPGPWSESAQRLIEIGQRHGIAARVFGSLMWRCVTGLDYLRDASDLDLLWPVDGEVALTTLLRDIAEIAARCTPPVDGEILFETGEAVQWLELHVALGQGHDSVLARSLGGVRLVRAADLRLSGQAA
ncbi:malonate decarboxylase holo-[acyl-carrier-protein] synthase [Lichenicoccus sp.]|uniref:malonate decarboxylase holo-[acyl-carrier-protein] synthase n=1 Tax=Lichenicoccus sp. TaxID=2781899 RepID=UPI003D10E6BD